MAVQQLHNDENLPSDSEVEGLPPLTKIYVDEIGMEYHLTDNDDGSTFLEIINEHGQSVSGSCVPSFIAHSLVDKLKPKQEG